MEIKLLKNNLQISLIILLTAISIGSEPFESQKIDKQYRIVKENDAIISDNENYSKKWFGWLSSVGRASVL